MNQTSMGFAVEHDEASVIRQILLGRSDLQGDLIRPHLEILRRFVWTKMGNDPNVEDIVQQTVLKAFTHLRQFRFEACFGTWLIRIALNEVAQHWRKRLPNRLIGLEESNLALQITDPSESPLHAYERIQKATLLHRAIGNLPEKYRVVVRMRDLEQRSISEVAKSLGLSVGAVKSRHHRGRSRMAQLLSGRMTESVGFEPRAIAENA
jgi:RNA polymerase sigma-70 factor, ECF subfamily